ncbi:hypothetical protein Bca101_044425 [Brassica carinata]
MGAILNGLLFYVCATFSIVHLSHSQNQQGFISLDCGLPSNESPYSEPFTNLTYISDAGFVHGGKTGTIHNDLKTHFMKPYTGLRYFPDGIRNCYNLSVIQDTKYLIRTLFVYGNYDGLNASPRFDLYLGPNIWTTVDAKLSGPGMAQEIIHITRSNVLEICLVKTGTSTPLISALELRPLPYDTYITRTGSLKYVDRIFFSNSENGVRYPEDVYDRAWSPFLPVEWTQINTTLDVVDSHKDYNPPQEVIKTAAIPANASEPMTFSWTLDTSDDETYAYLYMADIQKLRNNETREFDIIANGKVEFDPYSPMKFEVEVLFNRVPLKCEGGLCRVQLSRTRKSTLPPLMNALEIFQVIEFPQSETNQAEVIAMKNIRATYSLNKISWQGDPCVPKQFVWSGLRCNVIDVSTPPRIVALDLSSSGLSGDIPPMIQNLTQLQELYVSPCFHIRKHIRGIGERDGSVLNWSSRLKIAIESALGIEYLHIGCKPPMVHRDVKSTNILLGQHFDAKLADFGLSRSFLVGSKTHVSTTNVAGTIGYLDPEYYQKHWLTEKSDVYSFGIVLLEIITGQPVIDQSRDNSYIVEWAKSMLANGDIESIMDPKLQREYDTGSSWKALELAMACINPSSTERPNMTRIAHELNECLEVYENLSKRRSQDANSSKSTGHSISFVSDTPSAR